MGGWKHPLIRPDSAIRFSGPLVFEGEGCFNAYIRKSGKVQMQARLGMTDRDVVQRFMAVVGCGAISERPIRRLNHKAVFDWVVYEAELVRGVIEAFLPYLGERRTAKAREVLEIGANVQSHNSKKSHCPQGHALIGDNLILSPFIGKNGKPYIARRCRACGRSQTRERMRRVHNTQPDNYRVKE